jgi:tetratricopeptide (TPR) repeat protein
MNKIILTVLTVVFLSLPFQAQEHQAAAAEKSIELLPGMGNLHHPIAAGNPGAQQFFDQGLTLLYAFNHEDAARSFRRAAELDPKSPMPWWGVAMAVGPNYNMDVDPEREKVAYDAIQKALALAQSAPDNERAYVHALAARYSNELRPDYHKLAVAYRDAMRKLADRYPDDPDAVTLYAESMMDLRPWHLWSNDGKPAEDTEEIISRLNSVLISYPNHVGANHFYIHALEPSPHPERALPSAGRLATMVPSAGHLVHMPSHIYDRTGDFALAVAANQAAVQADHAYIERSGTQGSMYDMMYFTHNMHFLATECGMEGNSVCAIDTSNKMAEHVAPGVKQMPMLEDFLTWQPFMLARFARWDEILKQPMPQATQTINAAAWHYARGLAYASKRDRKNLIAERDSLTAIVDKVPADVPFGLNLAKPVLSIAVEILDGKLAALDGNMAVAEQHYRKAIVLQDQLNYDEPADWYYPVRETLGATLLLNGDASAAEVVFRDDLTRNPRNGRSLYGLWKSLEAQKRASEATWVQGQFIQAWAHADVQPNLQYF